MLNKIIGFVISLQENKEHIDFFNVNLTEIKFKRNDFFFHFWGIGDISKCIRKNEINLSFPLRKDLYDRNIIISFARNSILIENDWLGSIPVFYNAKQKIVSTISNFCLKDKEIDLEGVANFCEFGYSVFEQTIFKNVKFMRYYSKLILSKNEIKIQYKKDPILEKNFFEKKTNEKDTISLIQDYILDIESKLSGEIIVPTSGGYDSRLLNYLVKNKSKIKSFTYGISKNQSKSFETVYAKKISELLNLKWQHIELKEFNKHIEKWFQVYGYSTHLHGMYHIEFYQKILKRNKFKNATFLSGIIGDAWAEAGKFKNIQNYDDLIYLGYTHGLSLDPRKLVFKPKMEIRRKFFECYSNYLQKDEIKTIFAMRIKIMLISYLTQIPEYFGFPVWTPFLNLNLVKAILNIPCERRKQRIWQKDFFREVGLNIEEMGLKSVKSNSLDYTININSKFDPIDTELMKKIIKHDHLVKINNSIIKKRSKYELLKNFLLRIPKVGGGLKKLGIKNKYLTNLYDYYIIKSIEKGIKYNKNYYD